MYRRAPSRPAFGRIWPAMAVGVACSMTAIALASGTEGRVWTSNLEASTDIPMLETTQAGTTTPPTPPPATIPASAAEDATPPQMLMQPWRSWFNPDAASGTVAPRSLQEAIRRNDADEIQALLDAGWSPDGLTDVRETPLELAIRLGRIELAEELLQRGANPNLGSRATQTIPLQLAIRNRNTALVRALVLAGAQVDTRVPRTLRTSLAHIDDSPLHEAASIGDIEIAGILIAASARLNDGNRAGLTPLHHAIAANHVELAAFLLDSGAELNARGRVGTTPLHLAAVEGSVDAVRLLLLRGAEVNTSTRNGSTPLHGAIYRGQVEIVELLLSRGADRSRVGLSGETPLLAAQRLGYEPIIRLLEASP